MWLTCQETDTATVWDQTPRPFLSSASYNPQIKSVPRQTFTILLKHNKVDTLGWQGESYFFQTSVVSHLGLPEI